MKDAQEQERLDEEERKEQERLEEEKRLAEEKRKEQERLEEVIKLQKHHTLYRNKAIIGQVEKVLVEKVSKRSASHWAGRTDSNKWVIFPKQDTQIKDIVPVLITDAKGISLQGQLVNIKEAA